MAHEPPWGVNPYLPHYLVLDGFPGTFQSPLDLIVALSVLSSRNLLCLVLEPPVPAAAVKGAISSWFG